jgi:hypothetical protein
MSVINKNISSFEQSRRQFFSKILPVGTLCCFGCSACFASAKSEKKHKFLEDSGMSFQQVFDFAFKEFYIPLMQSFANEIGKDEFIETLKKARSELSKQEGQNLAKSLGKNDMASLAAFLKDNVFTKNTFTDEIVEETDQAFAANTTECLYAKTFREADAADIGYASFCHGDYAFTSAFNPEMKMIRTKTLMQGHDCCNHRGVMEG